jgi:hypothetical protein
MVSEPTQVVAVDDQWKRFDWKRQTAAKLLGEQNARKIARPLSMGRVWLNHALTAEGRENRDRIRQFKNIHRGERCVIIGNGPSLRETNLRLLRDEATFGLNRIYLMFDELGFETTYHAAINRLVIEQCLDEFRKIKAPLFTVDQNEPLLGSGSGVHYLSPVIGPWFSPDISRGVWEGHTVTYVAMQLAYYMGFSTVILVGVDHRFAVTGTPNQLVESTGPDASHFDPNYFAKGFKWQLPDLDNSEVAYRMARHAFEKDGRKIVDCTVNGALTVFPKTSLEDALQT